MLSVPGILSCGHELVNRKSAITFYIAYYEKCRYHYSDSVSEKSVFFHVKENLIEEKVPIIYPLTVTLSFQI